MGSPFAEAPCFELEMGLLIARRWKVLKKIGEGSCGSVYMVQDVKKKIKSGVAALKVESNTDEGGVLKLEVKILKRMVGRHNVAHLLHSAKRTQFSYMVTELLGLTLEQLTLSTDKTSSISTQVRIAIQCLFGLKQLHEVGFVHRDVKPANFAVGSSGEEKRIFHLLDFGLAREFIVRTANARKVRDARVGVLFRGTPHYASVNALEGCEQARRDDLWSMLYMIAELRKRLPWRHAGSKEEMCRMKKETKDVDLFDEEQAVLAEIGTHLRTLKYHSRPDYFYIFNVLHGIVTALNISFLDNYDWEDDGDEGKVCSMRAPECGPKTIFPDGGPSEESVEVSIESPKIETSEYGEVSNGSENLPPASSMGITNSETSDTTAQVPANAPNDMKLYDPSPFLAADFLKNELGF